MKLESIYKVIVQTKLSVPRLNYVLKNYKVESHDKCLPRYLMVTLDLTLTITFRVIFMARRL